jgi:hypothetical protein
MRRPLAYLATLTLSLVACGGGSSATTLAATTTENTATRPESSSSSVSQTTTTVSSEGALFAITAIDFADNTIEITNLGTKQGSLSGYQVCQQPSHSVVSEETLSPGQGIIIDASLVNGFDPESGELGLYRSEDFDNPEDIVSYVEWGRSDHDLSSTAVAAGIWLADGFVATTADTSVIATAGKPATAPDGWLVG